MLFDLGLGGKIHRLELSRKDEGWECKLHGRETFVQAVQVNSDTLSLLIDGKSFEVRHPPGGRGHPPQTFRGEERITVFIRGKRYDLTVADPRSWRGRRGGVQGETGPQNLTASMPGKVVRVLAREGDAIVFGQGVAVVEAMKMQNEIRSPRAGVLKKLLAYEGMKVNAGEVLAIVE